MKNCKHYSTQQLFNIANLILTLFSIIVAIFTVFYTTSNINRINAAEYKITDNFKSEVLEMVLALYSIMDKLEREDVLQVEDISSECEKLAALRLSPGYLLMMHSFKNEQEILIFDNKLLQIINLKSSFEHKECLNIELYIDEIKEIYEMLFNNIDAFVTKARFENLNQIKSFIEKIIDKND